jgi:Fe2+ transport system protein FeoA
MRDQAGADGRTFPLVQAREGERVRVVTLRGSARFVRRLTDLGLNVGAELVVSQSHGDGLVLVRGDMRLGIGMGASQRVMVTPAS